MDLLSADDLVALAEDRGGTRISLFLPTHRAGPRIARNRIRLKNLIQQAERVLREDGMPPAEVGRLLEPTQHLLEDGWSLKEPGDGLALFLAPDRMRSYRLPLRPQELVTVGERFFVRPLLPLLVAGGQFYVLALSQDRSRLYGGSRVSLEEVEMDGLPLGAWLSMPRSRPKANAFLADRGGSGRRTVFHGGGEEDDKVLLLHHFQRVDRVLRDVLGSQGAPLVLAGVRSVQAFYRTANTYPHLLGQGLDGSAEHLSPADLHRRAWPLVEPVLRAQESAAASSYRALAGTGRTSDEVATVLVAAEHGRVQELLLSTDASRPVGAAARLARLSDPPGHDDQLDRAAVATLKNGGHVYAVPRRRMPCAGPVAAILRY